MRLVLLMVALLFDRGGGVFQPGSSQQCLACGSTSVQSVDACERFSLLSSDSATATKFSGRHGHASAIFPYNGVLALWVVGGRGDEYERWNFMYSYERADIWVSTDGANWEQLMQLSGDFTARTDVAFLVEDVQSPGDVAPFWERFGHSLDVIEARDETTGGTVLIMLICGGFTPRPDNDIWVSEDGEAWFLIGRAPWSPRGYHSSVVMHNRVLVLGGSPLTNEIWAGNVTKTSNGWSMNWEECGLATGSFENEGAWSVNDMELRWSPRAGHSATVQFWQDSSGTKHESLFLTGGFSSWPTKHPLYDGQRARNDVWKSEDDGVTWVLLVEAAPWAARAWHSLVTWSDLSDPYLDVATGAYKAQPWVDTVMANMDSSGRDVPRMWMAGGGYVGAKDNNIVHKVDGSYDLWWTRDGVTWVEVTLSDAVGDNLCSSVEAYKVESEEIFLGKYGHTMVPFWRELNEQYLCMDATCSTSDFVTLKVPSLFFVAGDWGHYGDVELNPSSETYASRAAILCEIEGHKCPISQSLVDEGGKPPSYRRGQAFKPTYKLTVGGTCPDPFDSTFTANTQIIDGLQYHVFYLKDDAVVEVAQEYPYTAYSFDKWKTDRNNVSIASGINPHAPKIADYLDGYVARHHGCKCDGERQGEYCEYTTEKEGAYTNGPRVLVALVVAASVLFNSAFL